jgi:biotin-[acetyl-CoA-carboxylase] ligase BirA-like protein
MPTALFTDSPDQLNAFFSSPPSWRRVNGCDLPETQRNLWSAIGPGPQAWIAHAPNSLDAGDWDAIAIIDDAPDSQFNALQGAAGESKKLPASVACLALGGKNFRGNRNRPWAVEKGNLHLTTFHVCDAAIARVSHGFSLLPTVAATRALAGQAAKPGQIGIKWVNDILIEGQKVAGALTATQLEGDAFQSVVMGLGMNVARTPVIEASRFIPAAGCLNDLLPGSNLTLQSLFWKLLRSFHRAYRELTTDGYDTLLDAYRCFSCCLGKEVIVWAENVTDFASSEPLARGKLLAIESDLSLRIEGREETISKGRLTFPEHSWPMDSARVAD